MAPNLQILFENNQEIYYPGTEIRGSLLIEAREAIGSAQEVKLIFTGEAEVSWIEPNNQTRPHPISTYRSREEYFKYETIVWRRDPARSGCELVKGQYRYPFTFRLPLHLPSSFHYSGRYATKRGSALIGYAVDAVIVIKSFLAANIKVRRAFYVKNFSNLNELGVDLTRPGGGQGSKTLFCWKCKSGPINAELYTDKQGYAPGEAIHVNANIENLSRRGISATAIRLQYEVRMREEGKRQRAFAETLAAIDCGSYSAGCRQSKLSHQLHIPHLRNGQPLTLCGSLRHCQLVDIAYAVELRVQTAWNASPLCVRVAIHVGLGPILPASTPLTGGGGGGGLGPKQSLRSPAFRPPELDYPLASTSIYANPAVYEKVAHMI